MRDLIRNKRPDIVGLVEVSERSMEELAPLNHDDAYRVADPRGWHGVALLSRVPLEFAEIRPLVSPRTPFLIANVTLQGRPVTLGLVHTAAPTAGSRTALRNEQFKALAAVRREFAGREIVLMGDFNTLPWSLAFRRLTADTGLQHAAAGFGYRPTWPAQRPPILGIPIDHFLVSHGLVVHEFGTVGPTGSDHLGIYAEIGVGQGS